MTPRNPALDRLKKRIEAAIRKYAASSSTAAYSLIPNSLTSGKLYEAHVLSLVLEKLVKVEGLRIILVKSKRIHLKSAPGPINPSYPHFDIFRGRHKVAEIWTDIEFLTFSYNTRSTARSPSYGDYHELDIVMIEPNQVGRPSYDAIWLGVECKNSGYSKSLLKEILGIRRELSLLSGPHATKFSRWPSSFIPAAPPSCLIVYSTDPSVAKYAMPGIVFGIDFIHAPI